MTEPQITKDTRGPLEMTFMEYGDGSMQLDIRFTSDRRQIAQLFPPDMDAARAAAEGVADALMSLPSGEPGLEFEVSEHYSIEDGANLIVHDADGPKGWRYKVVGYPPDEGRWGLARMYVFAAGKRGHCQMEGRVRNVALAKRLADAMARHWRK